MIFVQSQLTLKALVLGFFCCLHVCAADTVETDEAKIELLSLHLVHPQNDQLANKAANKETAIPEGYQLSHLPIVDTDTGKVLGKRPILIQTKKIVSTEDVKNARATGQVGTISILLTEEAGEKMQIATQNMNLGRDRIAVMLEGRCVIAPTVQAKLGRNLHINGLGGKSEVKRLVQAFNK